jgi:hypothetical protein
MGYRRSHHYEDMTAPSLFALALIITVSLGSIPDMATLAASNTGHPIKPGMPKAAFAAGLAEPVPEPLPAPALPLAEAVAAHAPSTAPTKADGAVISAALRIATASVAASSAGLRRPIAPAEADTVRVVTAERLNVRTGPGTTAPILDQLLRGDYATVVAEGPDGWMKIRLEGDGLEGWVAGRFLAAE